MPTATMPAATTSTTNVSLNGGAALTNASVSMPLPVLSGYAQNLTLPIVNAGANTRVSLMSGLTPPSSIVPLQSTAFSS